MTLEDLLRLLPNARKSGQEYVDYCPVHELPDRKHKSRSLSIGQKGHKIVVHCQSGGGNCTTDTICKAVGVDPRDLDTTIVRTYDYFDESSRFKYQKTRHEPGRDGKPKSFFFWTRNGNGKWEAGLNGIPPLLFRLPQLVAKPDEIVFIPEGEKDVEYLESLRLLATTNATGAGPGKWKQEYSERLRGRNTVICADTDQQGLNFAEEKAQSLYFVAKSVKVLRPPAPFKDVSDWHPTYDQILATLSTVPEWRDATNPEEPTEQTLDPRCLELFDTREQFEAAPPLSFAIEGFLQSEAINALAAPSGNGKTWVALSLTRALLYGPGKLWDFFTVPKRFKRVIYLIPESMRGPIKERLKLMKLYDEIGKRLFMRTVNMGKAPDLDDPLVLVAVKNAAVILDTGVRFMNVTDESNAMEIAKGLSEDMLGLLRAGADHVIPLFHSPKSFQKETSMTLEGMIRGSSELGAVLATAWGLKQIDRAANIIHVENLKPRDFEPCGPFEIIGRPHIDQSGDFALLKKPGDCGNLLDEQISPSNPHNLRAHEGRNANLALLKIWMANNPDMSAAEIVAKFQTVGVRVNDSTARGYKSSVKRGAF